MRTPFLLHLSAILFITVHQLTVAQTLQPHYNLQLWEDPRFLSLSSHSPTAANLRSITEFHSSFRSAVRLLHSFIQVIDTRRQQTTSPCNLPGDLKWPATASDTGKKRQIPVGPLQPDCPMQIVLSKAVHDKELHPHLRQTAMQTIEHFVLDTFQAISTIHENPNTIGLSNWTTQYPRSSWTIPVPQSSQMCSVEVLSGYRVKNVLYLYTSMTNHPVDLNVPDFQRQYVEEWVREDMKTSLRMIQPQLLHFPNGSLERGPWQKTTTLFSRWGASDKLSSHGAMVMEDVLAITTALRRTQQRVSQAEDSLVPSNIAILALPLLMALVPSTVLGDQTSLGILIYVTFTDVMNVFPFLIKGVEPFMTGNMEERETVAYHVGDNQFGEIEMWAALCAGPSGFERTGAVFVAISVVLIVTGIAIEFIANRVQKRRRMQASLLDEEKKLRTQNDAGCSYESSGSV